MCIRDSFTESVIDDLNTKIYEVEVKKIQALYDARDLFPAALPDQRPFQTFAELPRFLRTAIFLFMRKFYQGSNRNVSFLRSLLIYIYKQKWSDFVRECENNAELCQAYDLTGISTLFRFGCSKCDDRTALRGYLAIIMDSSGSISPDDFARQKDFLKEFFESLMQSASTDLLIALINFSSYVKIESGFTSNCLLYTSPSPRDGLLSRMPSSA
eukprot:TRINITY_DN11250_c0_g1_i1.p2 TRINITY_DN11250_c0_g1~~TRINITY_DN11250_c0_g1_i1.p2  ORF type:complete len:233 (+),score=46.12 TRINITY_DN11250_c0_g1_i1:63-701(+)